MVSAQIQGVDVKFEIIINYYKLKLFIIGIYRHVLTSLDSDFRSRINMGGFQMKI